MIDHETCTNTTSHHTKLKKIMQCLSSSVVETPDNDGKAAAASTDAYEASSPTFRPLRSLNHPDCFIKAVSFALHLPTSSISCLAIASPLAKHVQAEAPAKDEIKSGISVPKVPTQRLGNANQCIRKQHVCNYRIWWETVAYLSVFPTYAKRKMTHTHTYVYI